MPRPPTNGEELAGSARRRPTPKNVLETVAASGREELDRSPLALTFSGLAGGSTLGLTALGTALGALHAPAGGEVLMAALLYPLGFIAVIIGRQQLFTENTLFPVVLVLSSPRYLPATARLWGIVFVTNQLGAAVFAALAAHTGALGDDVERELVRLGEEAVAGGFGALFWSAVVGGWIIALMAWMVSAAQWTIAQVVIVYLMTLPLAFGGFAHIVASAGKVLTAVEDGSVPVVEYGEWLVPVALGNVLGGLVMVTVLNYGQVVGSPAERRGVDESIDRIERE